MNNKEKLVNCYVQALALEASQVSDELRYNSIPEWDSTAHMLLIAELEGCFQVMFDMDDIIDMSSVAKCQQILSNLGVDFSQ